MAILFRKRIKLLGGIGVNLGKRGASVSLRTKVGSVSKRGVSLRTGIPGLTITQRFKKKNINNGLQSSQAFTNDPKPSVTDADIQRSKRILKIIGLGLLISVVLKAIFG